MSQAEEVIPLASFIPAWTFGDRVRKVRKELGMTQEEFAARMGVPKATVAAWEVGTNAPRNIVDVAKRMRTLWQVPVWWLLETDESPRPKDEGSAEVVRHQGLEPRTR